MGNDNIEQALGHADGIKQWMKDNPAVPDMPPSGYYLVLLAEEVRRLDKEVNARCDEILRLRKEGVCVSCGADGAFCYDCH